MKHSLNQRLIRYLLVGTSVAAFQFSCFAFFFELLSWHYQLSTLIAFILTIAVSFLTQRQFTYTKIEDRKRKLVTSATLFLANTLVGMIGLAGMMYVGVSILGFNPYVIQFFALGFLAVYNFCIFHVIFR